MTGPTPTQQPAAERRTPEQSKQEGRIYNIAQINAGGQVCTQLVMRSR